LTQRAVKAPARAMEINSPGGPLLHLSQVMS